AMAAELAAGAPPRTALAAAASRDGDPALGRAARLAEAGMAVDLVSEELVVALPVNGRLAAAAWHLVATAGGPASAMFELLAVRAADEGSLRRERRALTAQARASAAVVAGLPIVLLLGMAATGRLRAGTDPALGLVVAVGLGLQAAGLAVVWTMLRRSS
ncbi:MAG: type II secretion system F family protein, partial [Thermoanaerobaculia bacterium]|nr:type II secretion system F family protein [Thermoanaerobaculia bacterium]